MPIPLPSRLPFRAPSFRTRLNASAAAGPRRIAIIGLSMAAVGTVLVAATFVRVTPPIVSQPGRLPHVDPLPGGLNSNPHQDALALRTNQEAASREQAAGRSFTPQVPAGQSYAQKASTQPLLTSPSPPPAPPRETASAPTPAPAPAPAPAPTPAVTHAVVRTDAPVPARVIQAQAQAQNQQAQTAEDARYKAAIERVMNGWGSRPPRTDVILPPDTGTQDGGDPPRPGAGRAAADGAASVSPVAAGAVGGSRQRVLIPAGRGVYAHTILAASSDASSPVVLQADSGPIAGARMIGSFAREDERLVIRVNRVIHQGQEISAEGIVVAPATMEAGVASSVDQHYLARFILPAAASFVQGLGQAFALSNSSIVQSPFGGVSALQRLNLGQQVGVGAGVAAGRVGQALDQAAPRGPTVKLDVGSSVGVMFLSNVAVPG